MFPQNPAGKCILLALCGALSSHHFVRPAKAQNTTLVFPESDNDVYKSWLETASYEKSAFLPSTSDSTVGGVQIHWTVDNEEIHLAVVAQATGWAAFGLAESGSMRGADIILYTAETDTLVDSYVLDELVKPLPDDCQSWELVNSVVDNGIIIFEATRLLNTTDTQDRTIIDDSLVTIPATRVISAWGDSSEPSYHGKSTARGSIRFFGTSDTTDEMAFFAQSMAAEAEGNFTISARNFTIPSQVTTYQWFCFSREDLLAMGVPIDEDLHTIGIEPVVLPESKKYVHHFILYGSALPWNNTIECSPDTFLGNENAYTWAPGDLPLNLPSNVGGPLGSTGFQSFALEIHYNNVDLDVNMTDSSGIRAYYTSVKREFDLGIFQTGDPFVMLESGYVSSDGGYAQHSFGCSGECLGNYLTEPVTVLRETLHMHMTGASMVNYQIRNNQVIRQSRVDFWDFSQQGDLAVVQAPFQINPGDAFRTVCNYNAANTVQWGLASQEEMCIAFLYYYPRKLVDDAIPLMCGLGIGDFLPGCNATYTTTQDFTSAAQLERTFGGVPATCPNTGGGGAPTSTVTFPVASPTSQEDETSAAVSKFHVWTTVSFLMMGYMFS